MIHQGRRALAVAGGLMLAVWFGFGGATPAAACQEAEIANRAGAAFLNAARDGSASAFASALASHTDMDQITAFALGRYRSQLSPERRAELTTLTARYISTTLADFALKFRGSGIHAIECRPGEVVSRFERGARSAQRITWRVTGNKVVDVNVQNVWLGQLLRDNYASVIQRGGGSIDALFYHQEAEELQGQPHIEAAGECVTHAGNCTLGRTAPGSGKASEFST
jgi:phospholipid transport system substrate-binding protein